MFFKKSFCSFAYRRVFALLIGLIFFIYDYGKISDKLSCYWGSFGVLM